MFGVSSSRVYAAETLNIYLFWGSGCPHCAQEKAFLAKILPNYPNVKLNTYEVYNSQENANLMQKTAEKLKVNVDGVPFLIIGDKDFVGFADGTTDKEIESRIKQCLDLSCPNSVGSIVKPVTPSKANPSGEGNITILATIVGVLIVIIFVQYRRRHSRSN
jgi:glutaredoxin